MPHTIKMMFAIENYLVSQGCTILGPSAKKLGRSIKKDVPSSLLEQSDNLPSIGLKRFVQHNQQIFLVHVYIEDWPDRLGATVNIHTYGPTTIKLVEKCPTFYKDLDAGKFRNKESAPLFQSPSVICLQ